MLTKEEDWSDLIEANAATIYGREEQRKEFEFQKDASRTSNLNGPARTMKRLFSDSNFDYSSARCLGSGHYGDVFLIRNKRIPNHQFVIKRYRDLNPFYQPWRELQSLCILQHENICRIYGAYCSDFPTLVLEVCYGSARDFIDTLTTKNVLQIVVQIAKGLAFMHEKSFLHCDVKPENILIRQDNVAVLTDFGTCISLPKVGWRKDKFIRGSISYMNLDVLDKSVYSRSTDIWALACTAFRLEEKEAVIPPPEKNVDIRKYYRNALKFGVSVSRKRRKKVSEYFLRCKTLSSLLQVLINPRLKSLNSFLCSKELQNLMKIFQLDIRNINEVTAKFARDFVVEYVLYNEIVTRAKSTSTDPRFAEYYYESDDVGSLCASDGSDQSKTSEPEKPEEAQPPFEIAENRDVDIAKEAEDNSVISAAQSNQPDNTSSVESFAQTDSQPSAEGTREKGKSQNDQSRGVSSTVGTDDFKGKITMDTEVYFCHACKNFICVSKTLMRLHVRQCKKIPK